LPVKSVVRICNDQIDSIEVGRAKGFISPGAEAYPAGGEKCMVTVVNIAQALLKSEW
jgi:hypothetical protein